MAISRNDCLATLAILLSWLIVELLINPFGNFPINDDFFYSAPLRALVEEGQWHPVEIASPNAFTQIIWGWIFCLPFGFSYTAAKLSTLVLGISGTIFFYFFMRKFSASAVKSSFATLLLILNPLFLPLANSFMTDIPFFTLSMISIYFFLSALENDDSQNFFWGIFFSLLATLNRQFGIVVPLAFGITYLIKYKFKLSKLIKASLPVVIISVSLLAYIGWITDLGSTTGPLVVKLSNTPSVLSRGAIHLITRMGFVAISSVIYLGLFFAPILFLIVPSLLYKEQKSATKIFISYLLFSAIGYIILSYSGRLMPLLPNNIIDFGMGPGASLMRDGGTFWPKAPQFVWPTLTFVGLFLAASLFHLSYLAVEQVFYENRTSYNLPRTKLIYLVIFCLLYVPLISIIGPFDRYVVPLYLVLSIFLLSFRCTASPNKIISGMCVTLGALATVSLAYFSIAGTHDLFAMYTARHEALDRLVLRDRIPKDNIDGGLEFNGWPTDWEVQKRTKSSSWWNVIKDDYLVTLGIPDGYREKERIQFRRWLFWDTASIYILERK